MSSGTGGSSGKRKRESDSDGKTELDLEKKSSSKVEEISDSAKTVIRDKTDTSLAPPSPKRSRVFPGVDATNPKSVKKIETVHPAAKASSVPAPSGDGSSTLHTPPCTPDFKTVASSAAAGIKKPGSKELDEHRIESPDSTHVPGGGKVEPRKAFCTRCSKWVSLKKTNIHNLTRWNTHVEGCGQSPIKLDVARAKSEEAESSEDEGEGSKVLKFRKPVAYDTYFPLTPVSSKSSESTPASEARTSGSIASTESSPLITKGKKRLRDDEGHDGDSIGSHSTKSSHLDSKGSKRVKERHGDGSKADDAHKRHVPGVKDLLKLPGKAVKRVFK